MKNLSVMRGALRHEFGMQIRRRAVWVVIVFLGGFVALIWYGNASDYLTGFYTNAHGAGPHVWVSPSTTTAVLYWAMLAARFLPLGVGLLLADRLVRDRQTRVDELLQTTPGGLGARLTGKYLGTTLATLVPVLVLYTAVVGYMFSQRPDGHGHSTQRVGGLLRRRADVPGHHPQRPTDRDSEHGGPARGRRHRPEL